MPCSITQLKPRGLIRVTGGDATPFLQGLITVDVEALPQGKAGFGALLSPQGKVLFDFFIIPQEGGYLLDTPKAAAGALVQRLSLYKLRSQVAFEVITAQQRVFCLLGESAADISRSFSAPGGILIADPRHEGMGLRCYAAPDMLEKLVKNNKLTRADEQAYHARRIALGIPEAEFDYAYGAVFAHDINLDLMGGLSLEKGCFVGQEIVSRMAHRGSIRKRIVQISSDKALPPPGAQICVNDRPIGVLGSASGGKGLALIRTDRAKEAVEAGQAVMAGQTPVMVRLPA